MGRLWGAIWQHYLDDISKQANKCILDSDVLDPDRGEDRSLISQRASGILKSVPPAAVLQAWPIF